MRVRGYCCRRVSVTRWYCIKTDKDNHQTFFSALYPHHYGFLTPCMVAKF